MSFASWTDETIERLYTLWAEGRSFGEIAAALGVTKNTVIGKAHRLRLAERTTARERRDVARATRAAAPGPGAGVARGDIGRLDGKRFVAIAEIPEGAPLSLPIGAPVAPRASRPGPTVPARAARRDKPVVLPRVDKPISRRPRVDPGAPDPACRRSILARTIFQCAAPVGDERAADGFVMVCGAPTDGGTSWCAHHRFRFTTPVSGVAA